MEITNKRGFASDNNSGVHPSMMKAIMDANHGHTIAYGDDPYTAQAISQFKEIFGDDIDVYFVFIGSAANVLGLKAITESHNAVICSDTAHIHVDECGAPERFTGCKLLTVTTPDGKLTVDLVRKHMHGFGFQHQLHARRFDMHLIGGVEPRVKLHRNIRVVADFHFDGGARKGWTAAEQTFAEQ